jgi:Domain of unknown function (DUF4381)
MNPTLDPSLLPLRDIHLPQAVSWWPPAPGWWLLAGLALGAAWWLYARFARQRPKRAALKALAAAVAALGQGEAPVRCLQRISVILRRFAMTAAGAGTEEPQGVAGLTGERWLEFLDSRWPRAAFSHGAGRRLVAAPYAPAASMEEAQELAALSRAWIKAQRL